MANEERLIDANQLIKRLEKMKHDTDAITIDGIIRALKEPSTVDAVEVVRCFECQKEGTEACPMVFRDGITGCLCANTKGIDFCSYGERKAEE